MVMRETVHVGERTACDVIKKVKQMQQVFTVAPCILVLSKSFIYQLMHNRVALKEY
jgi:hypothetical protein